MITIIKIMIIIIRFNNNAKINNNNANDNNDKHNNINKYDK